MCALDGVGRYQGRIWDGSGAEEKAKPRLCIPEEPFGHVGTKAKGGPRAGPLVLGTAPGHWSRIRAVRWRWPR